MTENENKQDYIEITRWRKLKTKLKDIGLEIHYAGRDAHLLCDDGAQWNLVLQKLQEANRIINDAYTIAYKNSDNALL